MSIMTVVHVMHRIDGATRASPIAVFKTRDKAVFNAVFANTAITRKMISEKHPDLIGVYDGSGDIETIRKHLYRVARHAR